MNKFVLLIVLVVSLIQLRVDANDKGLSFDYEDHTVNPQLNQNNIDEIEKDQNAGIMGVSCQEGFAYIRHRCRKLHSKNQ